MNPGIQLESLLSAPRRTPAQKLALFALLNLGVIESLASGLMSAADGVRVFFHAENCLFVRRHLRAKAADEIMSRGVQLPDLFEALPMKKARRAFQRELAAIRTLCLKLLENKRLVA